MSEDVGEGTWASGRLGLTAAIADLTSGRRLAVGRFVRTANTIERKTELSVMPVSLFVSSIQAIGRKSTAVAV